MDRKTTHRSHALKPQSVLRGPAGVFGSDHKKDAVIKSHKTQHT